MNKILLTQTPFRKATLEGIIEGLQNTYEEKDLELYKFEFYNRFAEYIYKAALYKFRNYSNTQLLSEEVLQNTFITAFEKVLKFKFPVNSLPVEHDKIIKAWLGKIAENEAKKSIGRIINNKIDYDSLKLPEPEYEQFDNIYGDPLPKTPNEFMLRLQEALNLLSEKERHIILTYADEGCINTNRKQHISDSSLQYLCEYYQTTPEAIKQCKKRTLDKIKKLLF